MVLDSCHSEGKRNGDETPLQHALQLTSNQLVGEYFANCRQKQP